MYGFREPDFKKKQATLDQRKNPVTIRDLTNPMDLATIIHRLMVKRDATETRGRRQCYSGRARSIEDAYTAAKSYIPGITYEQVYKAVTSLYDSHLIASFCCTVQKRVHSPRNITTESSELRAALKDLNIKNPNYESNRIIKGRKANSLS